MRSHEAPTGWAGSPSWDRHTRYTTRSRQARRPSSPEPAQSAQLARRNVHEPPPSAVPVSLWADVRRLWAARRLAAARQLAEVGYLRGTLSRPTTQRQKDVLAAFVAAGGSVQDAARLVGIRPSTGDGARPRDAPQEPASYGPHLRGPAEGRKLTGESSGLVEALDHHVLAAIGEGSPNNGRRRACDQLLCGLGAVVVVDEEDASARGNRAPKDPPELGRA